MKLNNEGYVPILITTEKKATYLGDYGMRILFSNGSEIAIDFKSFLNAQHFLLCGIT